MTVATIVVNINSKNPNDQLHTWLLFVGIDVRKRYIDYYIISVIVIKVGFDQHPRDGGAGSPLARNGEMLVVRSTMR